MFEFDLFSWHYPLLILAGFIAGFINTMAGGGSLLTLPLLIFMGLPSAVANGTNRIAIFMSAFSASAGFKSKGVSNYPFNAYLGFAETFEYLVLFDNQFVIKKAKVLLYRESWGGEIGSKRWLKQFLLKGTNHKFIYRQNISAISGATISVKSMTNAVNELLSSLNFLIQNKII